MIRFLLVCLIISHYSLFGMSKPTSHPNAKKDETYSSPGSKTLAKIDHDFDTAWKVTSIQLAEKFLYPILLIDSGSFTFELQFDENRSESYTITVPPAETLKAIGHLVPYIYVIGVAEWTGVGKQGTWKKEAERLQEKIQTTLKEFATIDWSNPAWPGKEDDVKYIMSKALHRADNFLKERLKEGSYPKEDVDAFLEDFRPEMLTALFFSVLASSNAAITQLKKWKAELGDKWDDLYVSIYGSSGRFGGGLTLETNSNAIIMSQVMSEDQVNTNLFIAPEVATKDLAKNVVADAILKKFLAQAIFPTKESQEESMGIYKELSDVKLLIDEKDLKTILDKLNNGIRQHPFLDMEKIEDNRSSQPEENPFN